MNFKKFIYPEHNLEPFEHYFARRYYAENPELEYKYIPVPWTSYYVLDCNYGRDQAKIKELQEYINWLEYDKVFAVVQYANGILNDLSKFKDVKVFAMGGKGYEGKNCEMIPIPLLATPYQKEMNFERKFLASFVGRFDTHSCRKQLFRIIKSMNSSQYYYSEDMRGIHDYCEMMAKSIFALCPRGYGISSFRIVEAMQYGAIPVYISDIFWEPYGIPITDYCVKITLDQINYLPEILINTVRDTARIDYLKENIKVLMKTHFNYEACYEWIINKLKEYGK